MKWFLIALIIMSWSAEARYIQGIDNGSYKVYASEGQSLRQFTTTTPGYVNIVPSPVQCAESVMLLDRQNKVIGEMRLYFANKLNVGIPAGSYFIQVIPKRDCTINVALP